MVLIAGLGNPGAKYAGTRHNAGYRLVEALCDKLSIRLKTGKGPFLVGRTTFDREKIIVVQPTTFINNSGDAIQKAAQFYKIPFERCLICYDDLNLNIGNIRMRRNGSSGGHNGIKDIIQKFSTNQFPRLRIGIGNDFPEGQQINYVLSRFSSDEEPKLNQAIEQAVDASLEFAIHGVETAMNNFN